jgi:hypothetical protein
MIAYTIEAPNGKIRWGIAWSESDAWENARNAGWCGDRIVAKGHGYKCVEVELVKRPAAPEVRK